MRRGLHGIPALFIASPSMVNRDSQEVILFVYDSQPRLILPKNDATSLIPLSAL